MSSDIIRRVGPSLALLAMFQAAPVSAAAQPTRHDLGTFEGVQAQWWVVQELKDQFRAGWSFQNTTDHRMEFSYTIVFECSGSTGSPTRMGAKLKPGEKKGGQWEGMWSYPCKGTSPTSARIEKFTTCDPATTKVEVKLTPGGDLGVVKITRGNEVVTLSRQSLLELAAKGKGAAPAENAPGLVLKSTAGTEPVVVDLEALRVAFCGPGATGNDSVLATMRQVLEDSLKRATKELCARERDPGKCEAETHKRTQVAGGVRD